MQDGYASSVETPADFGEGEAAKVAYWIAQCDLAEKEVDDFWKRGDRVVKRYRDERAPNRGKGSGKFNILWANVETLMPVLYAKVPKPDVSPRWVDTKEGTSRLASTILERGLSYFVECSDFDATMQAAVKDRLLPGIGIARVRYVPTYGDPIKTELMENPDTEAEPEDDEAEEREVVSETISFDYVHWKDFLWSPARRWEEVSWVRFRSYLTRQELEERFPDCGKDIPLDYSPKNAAGKSGDEVPDLFKKAVVWEIWNRAEKKVLWVAPSYKESILDEMDDPLHLKSFFPCPKPLFATTTTEKMTPVPDYIEYQDQAIELDNITARIDALTRALKVTGVYAAAEKSEIQQLLSEDMENRLIPVEDWAALGSKGGLEGAILWLPIDTIQKVLQGLYEARERVKQVIYEVTGLSDIIRGQTKATETATAQQLKAQYGSIRVQNSQKEVARFGRDLLRLAAEILSEQFAPEAITEITGLPELPEPVPPPDQQAVVAAQAGDPQAQQAVQQQGEAFQQYQMVVQKKQQEFMAAVELLKNEPLRNYRVEIEADSTIAADENAEKQARAEYITAVGTFMTQAQPLVQAMPQSGALVAEMLKFVTHGFRAGRPLQEAIDAFADQISKLPPPQQQTDPALEKVKGELKIMEQRQQGEFQIAQQRLQGEQAIAQQKVQSEHQIAVMKVQSDHSLRREKAVADMNIAAQQAVNQPVAA